MCKYVAYNRFYQLRFYIYIGCFIIPIYTEIRCLQHSVTYYDRVTALSRMFLHNVKCLRYGTFREGGNRHKLEPVAYHCVCNILSFEMRVKRIFLRPSYHIGLDWRSVYFMLGWTPGWCGVSRCQLPLAHRRRDARIRSDQCRDTYQDCVRDNTRRAIAHFSGIAICVPVKLMLSSVNDSTSPATVINGHTHAVCRNIASD